VTEKNIYMPFRSALHMSVYHSSVHFAWSKWRACKHCYYEIFLLLYSSWWGRML